MPYLADGKAKVVAVEAADYDDEWLSLDLNVDIVTDIDAAIDHIREHGTSHSDAILTRSLSHAEYFVRAVDSSAVYVTRALGSPMAVSLVWVQKWQ